MLAQLPTAAGKTVCFAHISHKFFDQGKQVLVIAHRIELISQAAESSQIIGEPVGIIKEVLRLIRNGESKLLAFKR
ncbi:MAG: DEAD/DEAH box helicase family protein [Nostoc sp.]